MSNNSLQHDNDANNQTDLSLFDYELVNDLYSFPLFNDLNNFNNSSGYLNIIDSVNPFNTDDDGENGDAVFTELISTAPDTTADRGTTDVDANNSVAGRNHHTDDPSIFNMSDFLEIGSTSSKNATKKPASGKVRGGKGKKGTWDCGGGGSSNSESSSDDESRTNVAPKKSSGKNKSIFVKNNDTERKFNTDDYDSSDTAAATTTGSKSLSRNKQSGRTTTATTTVSNRKSGKRVWETGSDSSDGNNVPRQLPAVGSGVGRKKISMKRASKSKRHHRVGNQTPIATTSRHADDGSSSSDDDNQIRKNNRKSTPKVARRRPVNNDDAESSDDEMADSIDPRLQERGGLHAGQRPTPGRLRLPEKYTDRSMRRNRTRHLRERTAAPGDDRPSQRDGVCTNFLGNVRSCANLLTKTNYRTIFLKRDKFPINFVLALHLDTADKKMAALSRQSVLDYFSCVLNHCAGLLGVRIIDSVDNRAVVQQYGRSKETVDAGMFAAFGDMVQTVLRRMNQCLGNETPIDQLTNKYYRYVKEHVTRAQFAATLSETIGYDRQEVSLTPNQILAGMLRVIGRLNIGPVRVWGFNTRLDSSELLADMRRNESRELRIQRLSNRLRTQRNDDM